MISGRNRRFEIIWADLMCQGNINVDFDSHRIERFLRKITRFSHKNGDSNATIKLCTSVVLFLFLSSFASAEARLNPDLMAIQESYAAAMDKLVSGSGKGTYEVYAASAGKRSKSELKVKANVNVSFDRNKFYIHLEYEKDSIHHLESRIIVYDRTAILVNKMSKLIRPNDSEGDFFEAKPTLPIMRKICFDYNPCQMPAEIMGGADILPKYASSLTITPDANRDCSCVFTFASAPNLRCTFLASHNVSTISLPTANFLSITITFSTSTVVLSGIESRIYGM